ncbi:MAG TPA: FAD-dependent oxidoreductase [Beutenbergiaceae bacterium]|nr:FAD-dependent oxidoreductase [Beutenbergiaceae bacterium]
MAKVPTQADVVIVGAGIAGNSIAWHLADMGWRNIVLLEKGPLPDPGGSTGHASNFVFPVDHSKGLTDLTLDSVRQYTELGVLHDCGGLEVARTQERYAEFQRRMMSARSWGIEAHLVSPKEIGELVPYIDAGLLVGGFYTPSGAIVNPVEAGRIMRERAEELGALTTCENVEVTGFDVRGGRVQSVRTSAGEIAADVVVLACGVWSPKVAALGGATIPLTPAVHQMIDVGPIPEFEGSEWISFPLVRDMDNKMYERQRGPNLEIGSYAHRPILHEPDEIPRVGESEQASPTSFPFTPEDFSAQLLQARELFPGILGRDLPTALAINGLLSLTPDAMPLVGETEVGGLWSAAAVWIKEAPGMGRLVAQWITEGDTDIDTHALDIARFTPPTRTRAHVKARTAEGFPKLYGIVHPREQWESNRDLRTSPFRPRTDALGAEYFETAGWERPQWYESNAHLLAKYEGQVTERPSEWDARWWSPIIEAEHLAMREAVAMFDLSAFTIFDVVGSGALDFLQRVSLAQVDRPVGRVIYTPFLTPRGGFRSDLTIVRLAEDRFRVITGGADAGRDLAWLQAHQPNDGSVSIHDATSAWCTIGLWGPHARDVVTAVTTTDVSNEAFPFGTAQHVTLAGVPTLMVRISYVGDLGWEIHAPTDQGLRLWDAIAAAGEEFGIVPAGIGVYGTTGRLEKAHRLMGAELTSEYDVVEAGLALPKVKPQDFIGKEAYLAARDGEPATRLCTLTVEDHLAGGTEPRFLTGTCPVLTSEGEPITDARGRRSYTTSEGPAPSLGRYLALAYLPGEYAHVGTELLVEYFGRRYPVSVIEVGRAAPFDPEMERVKS